jgi:hypothetical protein
MKGHRTDVLILLILLISPLFSSISRIVNGAGTPFDPSSVSYYDIVKKALNLTSDQEAMLQNNGFVVVEVPNVTIGYMFSPALRFQDFYYSEVYGNDLPVFITTDSILHLFHVVFDCSVRMLEQYALYPMISNISEYAFDTSLNDYNTMAHDGSLRYWAVRNSTVYFAVGLSLITGKNVTLPPELSADEMFYLDQIYSDQLQFVPAGTWNFPSTPYNAEVQYDFTQFKVRGHYLGVPDLERYFRTFMWYGNYPIFVPRNDESYDWSVSHIDDAAIVYMRDLLKSNQQYYNDWVLVYNVTTALVGQSDSINLVTVETALHNAFGDAAQYFNFVAAQGGLGKLREELGKPEYQQRILSQALLTPAPPEPLPRYPIVFQFMGQRYVPDSYIFQMLTWDKVGFNSAGKRRIMPEGADVFAVLGSQRAYQLLTPDFNYTGYTQNLQTLEQDFNNLTEQDWTCSSYMAWMHALQSLVNVDYNETYPQFMRTLAWQDEKLNTALGSWAQLRHDTLLYAKQTYIPGTLCSYPEAFVEPNPTFYARMQKLTEKTSEAVSILPPNYVTSTIMNALETLNNATQTLETVSIKELAGQPLAQDETDFIKKITYGCGSGSPVGWYVSTMNIIAEAANYTSILDVPVVADVATFPPGDIFDPPQILHVADGYVEAVVVFYPRPDGTLAAAVGPVFSYYEFKLIGTTRLNDDEWKTILTLENRTEYLPKWLKDIYGTSLPWPTPEYNVTMLTVMLMTTTIAIATTKRLTRIRKHRELSTKTR